METIVTNQFVLSEKLDEKAAGLQRSRLRNLGIGVSTLRAHRQARKGISYAKFGR